MSTQQFQGTVEMLDNVDVKGTIREYREGTRTVSADGSLVSADSGKAIFVDGSSTGVDITLPAPAAGLHYKFWVKDASNECTVVTASSANIIVGSIRAATNATNDADGDKITITTSAVIGDHFVLSCDGTNWYVTGWCNANGGVTLTKAS